MYDFYLVTSNKYKNKPRRSIPKAVFMYLPLLVSVLVRSKASQWNNVI